MIWWAANYKHKVYVWKKQLIIWYDELQITNTKCMDERNTKQAHVHTIVWADSLSSSIFDDLISVSSLGDSFLKKAYHAMKTPPSNITQTSRIEWADWIWSQRSKMISIAFWIQVNTPPTRIITAIAETKSTKANKPRKDIHIERRWIFCFSSGNRVLHIM